MSIYIDTDISLGTPGAEIDDGVALAVLLRAAPSKVAAIGCVHGNADIQSTVYNAARVLHLLNVDIPIGRGAEQALIEEKHWFADWQQGYGPTPPYQLPQYLPHAVDLLIHTVRTAVNPITILAIGPLTNLALALRLAPDIINSVAQVIAMGGSFTADAQPEFNTHCDPEAAHIVLTAGWPVCLLGLEVTRQIIFKREIFEGLPVGDSLAALLKEQADGWITRVEEEGWENGGCGLHDAVAATALLHPEWFEYKEAMVEVVAHPADQRGITRVSPPTENGPTVQVATGMQCDLVRDFILAILQTDFSSG